MMGSSPEMDAKLKKIRNKLVSGIHDRHPVSQQFGRYDRYDHSSNSKNRIVPKVSRIQLGETIDFSSRPPHRVNAVGKIMATHVDSFKYASPSESLQELVDWGAKQDDFYHTLHLQVLALQARRKGDQAGAQSLDKMLGKSKSSPTQKQLYKKLFENLPENEKRTFSKPPNRRLYQSDIDRKNQLDDATLATFDHLANSLASIKQIRKTHEKQHENMIKKRSITEKLSQDNQSRFNDISPSFSKSILKTQNHTPFDAETDFSTISSVGLPPSSQGLHSAISRKWIP